MRRPLRIVPFCFLFTFFIITAHANQNSISESTQLFSLISQRLSLMKEVAFYKYQHQLPIVVPEVERKILANVEQEAAAMALPIEETLISMKLQIQMAVLIQEHWQAQWKNQNISKEKKFRSLEELRPEIAQLTTAIIQQLAKAVNELATPHLQERLRNEIETHINVTYVDSAQKQVLLQSLIDVAQRNLHE